MRQVLALFTTHPKTVNESYFGHLAMAMGFGARMIFGGLACLIHGLFPFLFASTGSQAIRDLHARMVTHRCREGGDLVHGGERAALCQKGLD